MIVRRFYGASVPEITLDIRRELGPNAVILETKRPSRWARWFRRGQCEVLAAVEQNERGGLKEAKKPGAGPMVTERTHAEPVEKVEKQQAQAPGNARLRLVQAVSQLQGKGSPLELNAGRSTVCALVGSTGVGKTTTIAKLAAHYALRESKKVALVTTDTYRVGAVEQLKTYGEIMGTPVEVVERPLGLRRVLSQHSDADLILIDTPGRNPFGRHLEEVVTGLNLVQPHHTLLLVNLATRVEEIRALLEAYRTLAYNGLIATKVDEVLDTSGLLELVTVESAPLRYLTTGQLVPDDLAVASAENVLAALSGRWQS